MKITSITILERSQGTDIVYLHTDMPLATYPFAEGGNQDLRFDVARGSARRYVAKHFSTLDPDMVEIISGG